MVKEGLAGNRLEDLHLYLMNPLESMQKRQKLCAAKIKI